MLLGWHVARINVLATVSHTGTVETGFGTTATAP